MPTRPPQESDPTSSHPEALSPAHFDELYETLRRLAQARISAEPGPVTLSATGLVHEAYAKLSGREDWADRTHVIATAARAMRQVLIDRARARKAEKRGGGASAVTFLDDLVADEDVAPDHVLAVDAALDELALRDPALARLVELRFFGGLEVDEAAELLGVSPRTAARYWGRAKAYLRTALADIG